MTGKALTLRRVHRPARTGEAAAPYAPHVEDCTDSIDDGVVERRHADWDVPDDLRRRRSDLPDRVRIVKV